MTVKELQEKLSTYDPSLPIIVMIGDTVPLDDLCVIARASDEYLWEQRIENRKHDCLTLNKKRDVQEDVNVVECAVLFIDFLPDIY